MRTTTSRLPRGNGRGIHVFHIDRASGAMTPIDVVVMGTSPSCVAVNTAGTRLYSANETNRVGAEKQGTASAFVISRTDGRLQRLNVLTYVSSGGMEERQGRPLLPGVQLQPIASRPASSTGSSTKTVQARV